MRLQVAGFVLAGGHSSRMGRDKALLALDGETLLERALRLLAEVCDEVAIAGGEPGLARYGLLIPDSEAGAGPLSGIIAALEASAAALNLFCPVDVPFVPRAAWQQIIDRASADDADVVLARVGGQVQPLCGVYRKRVAEPLRSQFSSGQRKVTAAIEAASVVWVDFDQPGQDEWFQNINTPEEYARILHPRQ